MRKETFKISCHDCGGTNIDWVSSNGYPILVCVDCENTDTRYINDHKTQEGETK